MFVDKQKLMAIFEMEFEAWERLLAGLSTAQITNPSLPDGSSIKDTMAHLAAWQQRTSARLQAALHDHEPRFPQWPVELDEEESRDAVDRANAWILATHRDRPWADVHREWREGFLRFLQLVRAIPESDLRPDGKLAWMAEYQFSDVLAGAYDHHHSEHRGLLEAWRREHTAIHGSD
jgi:hypothetical protein